MRKVDALVIGGGFYGCCIALFLKGYLDNVVIVEKEMDILTRASAINQARVHTGFHYPRSFLTAFRSLVNFPRFVLEFRKAIIDDFTKLYAIASHGSKVNSRRFYEMFRQMGADIKIASPAHRKLFNFDLVEDVFEVREVAFDASILREIIRAKLDRLQVQLICNKEVEHVVSLNGSRVSVRVSNGDLLDCGLVFNCTYSQINKMLVNSNIELLPLKHELTEMALIEPPLELAKVGITVMDGPFFSTMPYPARKLYTLSHVRYTPHHHWSDLDEFRDAHLHLKEHPPSSKYFHMIRDAQRYVPALSEARYVESLYEIKTVLLKNEQDDGRPIMLRQDHGIKNFSTVMGGKIDNIYDILEMIGETKKNFKLA